MIKRVKPHSTKTKLPLTAEAIKPGVIVQGGGKIIDPALDRKIRELFAAGLGDVLKTRTAEMTEKMKIAVKL